METVILTAALGVILGALGMWAFVAPRLSAARQRAEHAQQELERERTATAEQLRQLETQLHTEQAEARQALAERDSRIAELLQECSRLSASLESLRQRLEEDRSYRDELQRQLRLEFEQIASRILQERSSALKEQSTEALEKLLVPLRERITAFEEKVERAYTEHTKGTAALHQQLTQLFQLSSQLSLQADTLARALKGDKRLQGSWGEVQLERLLELSGLQRDVEYKVQVTVTAEDSRQRYRPDVIIYLPEGKHLIIDAKVSLSAYAALHEAESDEERATLLKHHISAIRRHIEELSTKAYHAADQVHSPEFVLLFMPIEAAVAVALQSDRELYAYAWERRIVLTSPTTLLATLRTVASVWKHERHNRTALQIADEAGKLYDKLATVLNDLVGIGTTLERTQRNYDEVIRRLCTGPGNVVTRAERLRQLGAKAQKEIDRSLVLRAQEDSLE